MKEIDMQKLLNNNVGVLLLSVAVKTFLTTCILVRGGFILSYTSGLYSVVEGSQSKNLGEKSGGRKHGGMLFAGLLYGSCSASYPARDGAAHSGLGSPMSLISLSQTWLQVSLVEVILPFRFLPPR